MKHLLQFFYYFSLLKNLIKYFMHSPTEKLLNAKIITRNMALLNLSILWRFESEYLITAFLSGLLSGAAGAYITHLLRRRNQNSIKSENYLWEAIEHMKLANFYWEKGKIRLLADEMEKAANYFLRASVYADNINRNWCEIFANNLLNLSRTIKDVYLRQIAREEAEKIPLEIDT